MHLHLLDLFQGAHPHIVPQALLKHLHREVLVVLLHNCFPILVSEPVRIIALISTSQWPELADEEVLAKIKEMF